MQTCMLEDLRHINLTHLLSLNFKISVWRLPRNVQSHFLRHVVTSFRQELSQALCQTWVIEIVCGLCSPVKRRHLWLVAPNYPSPTL